MQMNIHYTHAHAQYSQAMIQAWKEMQHRDHKVEDKKNERVLQVRKIKVRLISARR